MEVRASCSTHGSANFFPFVYSFLFCLVVTCPETVNPQNNCRVVDGSFQVFLSGDIPGIENRLKALIQEAMKAGDFNKVDPAVVSVLYISNLQPAMQNGFQSNGGQQQMTTSTSSNANNKAVYYGAAAGAVFVLGALVFYGRRHSKAQEEADSAFPSAPSAV